MTRLLSTLTSVLLTACLLGPAPAQAADKRAGPRTGPKEPHRVGVIIALGVGHKLEARPTYKMVQRVTAAVGAYRQKRAKYILFSGGHTTGHIAEADEMKIMAQAMGVPARAILSENGSISTGQNARNAARIVARKRFRSALLVTHKSHMARAMKHFRKRVPRLRRIYRLYADDYSPGRVELEFDPPLPEMDEFQAIVIHGQSRTVDFLGDTVVLDRTQRALARTMVYLYQSGVTDIPYFVWHGAYAVGHITRAEVIAIGAVALGLPSRKIVLAPARRNSKITTALFERCTLNGWKRVLAVLAPGRDEDVEMMEQQYLERGISAHVIVAPEIPL
jgi:uncharacterized SAM-binding protein YcdF (DUF218 family)